MTTSSDKVVDEAQRLLRWGNRDAARRRLTHALHADPHEPRLWYWLAQALDNREHAREALERALRYDETFEEARALLVALEREPPVPNQAAAPAPEWETADDAASEADDMWAAPAQAGAPVEATEDEGPVSVTDWLMDEEAPEGAQGGATVWDAGGSRRAETQDTSEESPITLDWLMDEAPSKGAQGGAMAWFYTDAEASAEEDDASGWSLLAELEGEPGAAAPQAPAAPAAPDEAEDDGESWSLLAELESSPSPPGWEARPPSRPTPPSSETWQTLEAEEGGREVSGAPAFDEADLWARAEQFLGPAPEPSGPSGGWVADAALGGAAQPPRGVFALADAPPSVAASIPVRNTFPPLSPAAIEEALAGPRAPAAAARQRAAREKRRVGARARGLGRLLALLLVLGLVGGALWYALRYDRVPAQVANLSPPVATQLALAHFRLAPPPTPLPRPEWVEAAQTARYSNQLQAAERLLREGLATSPNDVAGLLALSDLLRERPGGEAEALDLAQRALDVVNSGGGTLAERARATESLVWAAALQPAPDVANLLVRADEATFHTPNSPHAQWARAMALAVSGDGRARGAMQAASLLGTAAPPGLNEAKAAAVLARLAVWEEAAQRYEAALDGTDYLPWRVALVQVLRELGRTEEAQRHLDRLLDLAPDDPAVQALQS